MKFIETTLPWIALMAGLVCLIACIFWKKDKQWFWGICVANVIVLGMACILPRGPALLLSPKYPTIEQKKMVAKVWNHLARGTNAPPQSVSKIAPPIKKSGSHVWWKSFWILLPFTLVCGCLALEEKLEEKLKEKKKQKKENPKTKNEETPNPDHHFWKMDFWDIVSLVIEGARLIRGGK